METPPPDYHETENVTTLLACDWMNDVSIRQRVAEQTANLQTVLAGDVTCEALHLALNAIHIDMAWHAGVVNTDVAMEDLHRAIGRAIRSSSIGVGRDEVRDIL